jgi:transcriptional regulator with XRE-family HTH domain
MEEKPLSVSELLFEHYMIYQHKQKREIKQKEFADLIGIDDKLYNHIYRGRKKAGKNVIKQLADFFNDLRFYDAADMPRPDPLLFSLQRNWEKIPNAIKKKFSQEAAPYLAGDDE